MKKLLFGLLILGLLFGVAADLPPALPSSFYGVISGYTDGRVCAYSGGVQVKCVRPFIYNGGWVYTMNIPMDGVEDGALVRFYIHGNIAGKSTLHSGTNVRLNLSITGTAEARR